MPEDCDEREDSDGRNRIEIVDDIVKIVPNPFHNSFELHSNMPYTEFEIYSSSGQTIKKGSFYGEKSNIDLELISGFYYVKYKKSDGLSTFINAIKI